jgi:periplasmic divalent cation tolerance protein
MTTKQPAYVIITTTCPDENQARRLANALIEQELAACVQTSVVQSIYRWQGRVEHVSEVQLQIKTKYTHYSEVERVIMVNHPYETPEILACPVLAGSTRYLAWMDSEIRHLQSQSIKN